MMNILKKTNFPFTVFLIAIVTWIFLAVAVFLINKYVVFTGNNLLFPFSVIYPSSFLIIGSLFCLLFLGTGLLAYQYHPKLNFFVIYMICALLIVFGNMGQGNVDIAFLQPFYLKGRQYYADAINITDWKLWMLNFNHNLESFQMHTRTHPPYTTLIHYAFLELFNGSILGLSLSFLVISLCSFPLMNLLMKNFRFDKTKRKFLLILFAVIPSVNIYLLVSIDALVLTSTLLFLCGISTIFIKNKLSFLGILMSVSGLILTNMLTFSGLFLFAFLGLLVLVTLYKKQYSVFFSSIICFVLTVAFFYGSYEVTGSNHWETFREASHSENPNGFMLLHSPVVYFFTRLEDIGEILIFLSFAYMALFFSFKNENLGLFSDKQVNIFSFTGLTALGVMFLTGAYGTGETARACLYIVPFFLLFLKELNNNRTLKVLYILCLLQTFGMQLIGNYYW
ncbi:hypothetical protein A0O34_18990 [Chryseobacterium glaciei]|uniref:Glycosyltransferase RgtA/B/C/D-like domain-containing protein n=1 Tax=Chryseobacterium glaciei TaxID=1685010 RepID=A0A172Y042_9FLAO|nr:hypothetical protein [Chryseobacterium glaciei]ANF52476.1 hypothetical protein A0O34_18990 [Chryseobacterium glaciei]